MLYVFDTSSIRILGYYYPKHFPTFWNEFEEAVNQGVVVSVREVRRELPGRISYDPWLLKWFEDRKHIFLEPSNEEGVVLSDIFSVPHFQGLIKQRQQQQGGLVADPFIIACAKARMGTVVTEEKEKKNAPQIPNVCKHFDVGCVTFEGFLQERDWKF